MPTTLGITHSSLPWRMRNPFSREFPLLAAACGEGVSVRDANDEAEGSGCEHEGSLPKKNAHPSGFG